MPYGKPGSACSCGCVAMRPAPTLTMRQALTDPALLGKVLVGDSWLFDAGIVNREQRRGPD